MRWMVFITIIENNGFTMVGGVLKGRKHEDQMEGGMVPVEGLPWHFNAQGWAWSGEGADGEVNHRISISTFKMDSYPIFAIIANFSKILLYASLLK